MNSRCSSTVSKSYTAGISGMYPSWALASREVFTKPLISMRPVNRKSPVMHLMMVDFPAPLGPQQNPDLPVAHGEGDVVVGQGFAIALGHAADG